MPNACPIPTPAEQAYGEILGRAEEEMLRKVYAALEAATEQARSQIEAAGLDLPPPDPGYLTSVVHQRLYCRLCGADPETFAGGNATMAIALIRNAQNIARHYWGAQIEPYPKA